MRSLRMLTDLLLRAIIVVVFTPHAIGKVADTEAFTVKFDVSSWQTYALGALELAAVVGMIVGALLVGSRWRLTVRATVTRLAAGAVVISQVLAIVYAHHEWLEYLPNGNMEYNVTLILVALALAASPALPCRRGART